MSRSDFPRIFLRHLFLHLPSRGFIFLHFNFIFTTFFVLFLFRFHSYLFSFIISLFLNAAECFLDILKNSNEILRVFISSQRENLFFLSISRFGEKCFVEVPGILIFSAEKSRSLSSSFYFPLSKLFFFI